jgi:hypothetical protein
MRPAVRKSQNFQFIPLALARQFSFLDAFVNFKVTAETGLKCICVYIHPMQSEFMPV